MEQVEVIVIVEQEKMVSDLYLRNGLIVTEHESFQGGIVVHNGKIIDLTYGDQDIAAKEVIDLNEKIVFPGLVDMHVHFHSPGREHWEGYYNGSLAAAAGGVTTAVDMPLNGIPPTTDLEKLLEKRRRIQDDPIIDYAHWAGLVDNNLDAVEELHAAGVVGFKAFLSGAATEEFKRIEDGLLYGGLMKARNLGTIIAVHAECHSVINFLECQLQASGRKDLLAWSDSRPPATELEAINRALFWAGITQSTLHIVHVSIAAGVKAVARAKSEGIKASVETCPHYLFFDEEDYARIGSEAKCDPPLRSRKEVNDLWECVINGLVDNIASDHSPTISAEKDRGKEDIFASWAGITGIQTMLPVVLTRGVHQRSLPLSALVRMMSANPARLTGLYPRKGSLMPGSDADIAIIDLDKEWTLTSDLLYSKNKHSPYIGTTFKGSVLQTIVRGRTVFNRGKFQVQPGFGQLIYRMN